MSSLWFELSQIHELKFIKSQKIWIELGMISPILFTYLSQNTYRKWPMISPQIILQHLYRFSFLKNGGYGNFKPIKSTNIPMIWTKCGLLGHRSTLSVHFHGCLYIIPNSFKKLLG